MDTAKVVYHNLQLEGHLDSFILTSFNKKMTIPNVFSATTTSKTCFFKVFFFFLFVSHYFDSSPPCLGEGVRCRHRKPNLCLGVFFQSSNKPSLSTITQEIYFVLLQQLSYRINIYFGIGLHKRR